MSEIEQASEKNSNRLLQAVVVLIGLLVFFVVFFADKSALNNKKKPGIAQTNVNAEQQLTNANPAQDSSVLNIHPRMEIWLGAFQNRKGKEKLPFLDSIVVTLRGEGLIPFAADFATERVVIDRSLQNVRAAADLSRQASRLDVIRADSVLFRRYSDMSIAYYREILTQNPEDEAAMLELGLSLVESGKSSNSMQGILTIRKILEINPDNAEASFRLGIFSLQTGQLDKAQQRFEKVLELDSGREDARYQLALTKARLGAYAEARSLLDEVIKRTAGSELAKTAKELKKSLP